MLPAPDRKEQYALEPDHRFPEPERQPSYTLSEPDYDARISETKDLYSPLPDPSIYGPHFEKGPSQEQIWKARKNKELWTSEKEISKVPL